MGSLFVSKRPVHGYKVPHTKCHVGNFSMSLTQTRNKYCVRSYCCFCSITASHKTQPSGMSEKLKTFKKIMITKTPFLTDQGPP
jgi:hypothetical protein